MRRYVAPVLCALMMIGAPALMIGCHAEATVATPPPPPPPPPPPAPPPPAAPAPAPKPHIHLSFKKKAGGGLELPGPVVFKPGSDVLEPESDPVLDVVNDYMAKTPNVTLLRVEGHTDNDGAAPANQILSEKRSLAVAHWLVAHGTDCHRMLPVGFGQMKPIADNGTPEGKAQNRRVDFVDAAISGKPIAALPVDGGGKAAGDPCK